MSWHTSGNILLSSRPQRTARSFPASFGGVYEPLSSVYRSESATASAQYPTEPSAVPSVNGSTASIAEPAAAQHLVNSRMISYSTAQEESRSMGAGPTLQSAVNGSRTPSVANNNTTSEIPYQVLQDRLDARDAVNLALQRELDKVKHELSRVTVDNSRLQEQISIKSASESFLRQQLDNVVSRQRELLSFETTAEGQGKVELLEMQNRELRRIVELKESELQGLHKRLRDVNQKMSHLEMRLLQDISPLPKGQQLPLQQQPQIQAPQLQQQQQSTGAQDKVLLALCCDALSQICFVHKGLCALHHVLCTPHYSVQSAEGLSGGTSTDSNDRCRLTQRVCSLKCLQLASQGRVEDDVAVAARGYNRSLADVVGELHEVAVQAHTTMVTSSSQYLGLLSEREMVEWARLERQDRSQQRNDESLERDAARVIQNNAENLVELNSSKPHHNAAVNGSSQVLRRVQPTEALPAAALSEAAVKQDVVTRKKPLEFVQQCGNPPEILNSPARERRDAPTLSSSPPQALITRKAPTGSSTVPSLATRSNQHMPSRRSASAEAPKHSSEVAKESTQHVYTNGPRVLRVERASPQAVKPTSTVNDGGVSPEGSQTRRQPLVAVPKRKGLQQDDYQDPQATCEQQ